jgi:hypothetical protein
MYNATDALHESLFELAEKSERSGGEKYAYALRWLEQSVSNLMEGPTLVKRDERAVLRHMIARGRRLLLIKEQAEKNRLEKICGRKFNGHECQQPKGTACPDCGPAAHDYTGE